MLSLTPKNITRVNLTKSSAWFQTMATTVSGICHLFWQWMDQSMISFIYLFFYSFIDLFLVLYFCLFGWPVNIFIYLFISPPPKSWTKWYHSPSPPSDIILQRGVISWSLTLYSVKYERLFWQRWKFQNWGGKKKKKTLSEPNTSWFLIYSISKKIFGNTHQ